MSGRKLSLDELMETGLQNANSDRALISKLLFDLMNEMTKTTDRHIHKEVGDIAASYAETLQRSNEQIVKLASIQQRRESVQSGLGDLEKDQIFDAIKGE